MISISVDLQYVDEVKAVFHVKREPYFGLSAIALAGLMAAELRKEHGEDGEWFAKLAPMASTEGSTWKDRRESKEFDRDLQERWIVHEITVRFWTDKDSLFKLQPDGSYAVSMYDLTKGARKGPIPLEVKQQGQK